MDFPRSDLNAIRATLIDTDWTPVLSETDANSCVALLNNRIAAAINAHVPHVFVRRGKFPKWFSPALRQAIKLKNKEHRAFKKTGFWIHYSLSRIYRRMSKKLYKLDHTLHLSRIDAALKEKPSSFWRYIKNHLSDLPTNHILRDSGVTITDPTCQANLYASHFLSVFTRSSPFDISSLPPSLINSINVIPSIPTAHVLDAIQSLKPSNSVGPDLIPSTVVLAAADILAPLLAHIFNTSLTTHSFPTIWNSAFITPVFKNGDRSLASNYRPISICCVFSKVFERTIHSLLAPQIYPLLDPCQHGFRPSMSTTSNLVSFLSTIGPYVVSRRQVDAVYFDMVKAFDRVDHGRLLFKLHSFGFHNDLVQWFLSYLSHRTCFVRLGPAISFSYTATSGVHQGSILGPLLFLIFVNDLGSSLSTSYLLFADDLKLFQPISDISSCQLLQSDINFVLTWASENGMEIHPVKSLSISFSRSTTTIPYQYFLGPAPLSSALTVRDLGVILDSRLLFTAHLDSILLKASRAIGMISGLRHGLSLDCYLTLYKSLVRPILEFSSPVWNSLNGTMSARIENIQRRFIRTCYFRHFFRKCFYSYDRMCAKLGLDCLHRRRQGFEVLFLAKALTGGVVCSDVQLKVVVLPPGRRAGRLLYIRDLSPVCPLVRCVSSLNSTFATMDDLPSLTSIRKVLSHSQ